MQCLRTSFGLYLCAVLAVPLNIRDCEDERIPAADSFGDAGQSSSLTSFDAQQFLCDFTGGPAGDSHDMMAGRRYTPAERARARQRITAVLRDIPGLSYREHRYEWTDRDCMWTTRAYMEENQGSGINLLAELPATRQTAEWILVGAHYDSVSTTPGADDNASGVTSVLLVAQQLAQLPTRNANVLFAFFDQEEEGLIGSHALARVISAESESVVSAHVIDMIGWDSDDDRVVELAHCGMPIAPNDSLMQLYRRAMERLNARGEYYVGDVIRRESCRSDHVYLTEYGIPTVQACEEFSGDDVTPYYHRAGDTCDTLDYTFIDTVSALVAEAVILQLQ